MDAWDHLRRELGPAVGEEMLRRMLATDTGQLRLCVRKVRGQVRGWWVEPPEEMPLTRDVSREHNQQ